MRFFFLCPSFSVVGLVIFNVLSACPVYPISQLADVLPWATMSRSGQQRKSTHRNVWCYFPSLWMNNCKAQALFSIHGGRKNNMSIG